MPLIYRLMGIVARLNERLSHTRVNLVPLNWAVTVVLGVVFALGVGETRDAVVNGDKPRPAPLAEVLAHRNVERNYVTVTGELHPEAAFQLAATREGGGTERIENTWVPMLDANGNRALFVEIANPGIGEENPRNATITGMLEPLNDRLRGKIMEMGGKIDTVPLDTEYMLVEGHSPGNPVVWGVTTVLAGLLFFLFIITFLKKYVVFQKTSSGMIGTASVPSVVRSEEGIDLRVTGKFVLDEKNAQRFLDVSAGMANLETGELAFVSNIDASHKFMGVTTQKRAGVWAIVIRRDSLRNPESGLLYVGFAARPALRIGYTDAATDKPGTAVLSFANESDRTTVIEELNRAAGYNIVRT